MRALTTTIVTVFLAGLSGVDAQQQCAFTAWKKFSDSKCTRPATKYREEANIHEIIDKAIQSGECVYQQGSNGLKFSAECTSQDTFIAKFYNFNNEDKGCTKPYGKQEIVPGLSLPPLTLKNNECSPFGPGTWIIPSVKSTVPEPLPEPKPVEDTPTEDAKTSDKDADSDSKPAEVTTTESHSNTTMHNDTSKDPKTPSKPPASGEMSKSNMSWSNYTMEGDGYKVVHEQGMSVDPNGEQYLKQIQEFDKTYYYAIDHMGAEPGSTIDSCHVSNECTNKYEKHCCVNVLMQDESTGKENSIYRCMNQMVADANMEMTIMGAKVSMKCIGESTAKILKMASTAMIGLTIAALN